MLNMSKMENKVRVHIYSVGVHENNIQVHPNLRNRKE